MKLLTLVAVAAILSACSQLPGLQSGSAPYDPDAPLGTTRYSPVLAGTVNQAPVEPSSWLETNERVAPKAGAQ